MALVRARIGNQRYLRNRPTPSRMATAAHAAEPGALWRVVHCVGNLAQMPQRRCFLRHAGSACQRDRVGVGASSRSPVQYRPDIDGLRAVAVVPVLLYHAGVAPFAGGYVGVDVFFVISGYLITTIIAEDVGQRRFSVLQFYERRARRSFPALFVLLLVCFCVGFLLLMPADFRRLGATAAAMTLFASNLLFSRQAGYFDTGAELNPLLHTWSLAVEEQYYLAFPLVMAATS